MDVLVNATTLVKGGGIQVAASFIAESLKDDAGIRWHYAISAQVAAELESLGCRVDEAEVFQTSPTRDKAQRRRLLELEQRLAPDVVFSVFGPAYVRFRAPHLCGVAVGWVTHSTRLAFATLPGPLARLRTFLMCVFKGFWLRFADRWVVEAENARRGMQRRLRIDPDRVDVVPNTCAAVFSDAGLPAAQPPSRGETLRLLYVSAYYPHKNIEIIPEVAAALARRAPDLDFEFVVTLPTDEPDAERILQRAEELGVGSRVRNAGRVNLMQLIDLYRDVQLCFMPSLLETFSATYPEAMALGRPIVTSDLDFARASCGDAAQYYAATDPEAAATTILELAGSEARWSACLAAGHEVLAALPDARRKYELYVEAIRRTRRV